jgi:replication fork protection complex subunit Tof1/Swi1
MFKDNKLRLLMTLVGFSRVGEAHDPNATWIIPSTFTSTDLEFAIDLLRKYEFDPPTYEDGKGPEDLIRNKASAARRSTRRVDFDDDDEETENIVEEDHGEYRAGKATERKPDGERKKLKRRQRVGTPVELDDEEKDRRAEARRKKELEKFAKQKSTEFVHDSDEEDDDDKDMEFFRREEALRTEIMKAFGKSLTSGSTETATSKKRKAEDSTFRTKRRKTPPKRKAQPFADSDDSDEDVQDAATPSSRAPSLSARDMIHDESEVEDEATDTPLSSQHANGVHESDEDTTTGATAPTTTKSQDVVMAEDDDEEDEATPVARRPMARKRGAFIVDSDSE